MDRLSVLLGEVSGMTFLSVTRERGDQFRRIQYAYYRGFRIVWTCLPFIVIFYLLLGILEDSGYLPRLAMMVDGYTSGFTVTPSCR